MLADWAPYERTLKNPIKNFALGQDLIQSSLNVTVLKNGSSVYQATGDKEVDTKALLKTVFEQVCPSKSGQLYKELECAIESKSELASGIESFLGTIEEDSRLSKVLKCMGQSILSPAAMRMRKDWYTRFPYKTVKGTWKYSVDFLPHSTKISHRRMEQSGETEHFENYFNFEWQLELTISNGGLLTTQFSVTNVKFHVDTTVEWKSIIHLALRKVVRDATDVFSTSLTSLTAHEVCSYSIC